MRRGCSFKIQKNRDENIKLPTKSDNSLLLPINYIDFRPGIKFDGQYLKQDKVRFNHENVVNIYIAYEINFWSHKQNNDFRLRNSLFGAAILTKNTDFDIYKYSRYRVAFDARGSLSARITVRSFFFFVRHIICMMLFYKGFLYELKMLVYYR